MAETLSPDDPRPSEESAGGEVDDDAVAPTQAAHVVLTLNVTDAAVGSSISIRVVISSARDVASVPFHVTFDPAVLQISGAREGLFLRQDGRQTVFLYAPSGTGGRVVIAHSRLGHVPGVSGDGELCTLNFVAIGKGEAKLGVERAFVFQPGSRAQPSAFEVGGLVIR